VGAAGLRPRFGWRPRFQTKNMQQHIFPLVSELRKSKIRPLYPSSSQSLFFGPGIAHPSCSAASRVPSTRERIFAKAVSRAVERSSPKGEKPRSSVVPSSAGNMNSDASSTRSLTSWGVSTFGLIGSITPTKTLGAGANSREQSGERAVYPARLRAACKSSRLLC
jgi:hypothetical protein